MKVVDLEGRENGINAEDYISLPGGYSLVLNIRAPDGVPLDRHEFYARDGSRFSIDGPALTALLDYYFERKLIGHFTGDFKLIP
jgi:hypothetical protein